MKEIKNLIFLCLLPVILSIAGFVHDIVGIVVSLFFNSFFHAKARRRKAALN
jgi:hypothetical protein